MIKYHIEPQAHPHSLPHSLHVHYASLPFSTGITFLSWPKPSACEPVKKNIYY